MTGARGLTRRSHVEGQKTSGDIRYWEDSYTTDATEVTGAVLQLAQLPIDSYFLPEKSWFFSEGTGGTTVVITSIGDELVADRYAVADLALTAASTVPLTVTAQPATSADPLEDHRRDQDYHVHAHRDIPDDDREKDRLQPRVPPGLKRSHQR